MAAIGLLFILILKHFLEQLVTYVRTEIISLKDGTSSLGEPLLNARTRFGIAVVNWNDVSKLIAFGDRNESNLDELLHRVLGGHLTPPKKCPPPRHAFFDAK